MCRICNTIDRKQVNIFACTVLPQNNMCLYEASHSVNLVEFIQMRVMYVYFSNMYYVHMASSNVRFFCGV